MLPGRERQTNRLLGYAEDARLLILNADDFGLCNATNEAIFHVLQAGVVRSTTLMVPCPWARHAMHWLAEHPEVAFGVHLTAVSDAFDYPWGPVCSKEKVPSLVDSAGHFYRSKYLPQFMDQLDLSQLEMEFRTQIEIVLATGLKPSHLDWHSLRISGSTEIPALLTRLAREYGLALRVMGRSWIDNLQGQGFPTLDYDFLDSSGLDPARRAVEYAQRLHALPPGLSEWAVHPGLDTAELLALEPNGRHFRQTDYDFWVSPLARALVAQEGIILLDYRALQAVWGDV